MKKFLLIISLSFICNYLFAQLTFSKVFYDSSAYIYGNSVVQTPDKGYLIAGSQTYGGFVLKLDSAGGQVWKKYYNQSAATGQNGFCIAPTNDSCYIVAGAGFCLKIDALGDTLWTRTLPTEILSVQQAYDHGYIMASTIHSASAPYIRIGVVKLDSTGNLEWSQVVTSTGYSNYPNTIRQTPDSGYVVWGTLNNTGIGMYASLIKLSPSGSIQWSKKYSRAIPTQIAGCSMEILTDGFISFLIADNNPYRGILTKMDFGGNVMWNKSNVYLNGTMEWFTSKIHQTRDGGFVVAIGYQIDYGPGYMWRADSSGNFLWAKEIMTNPLEAIETDDNGYLILGKGAANPAAFGVVKTDPLGNAPYCIGLSGTIGINDSLEPANFTTTAAPMGPIMHISTTINIPSIYDAIGCASPMVNVNELNPDKPSLNIFPNPSNGNFVITFQTIIKNGRIELLNILGENLFSQDIFSESKKQINLKNIPDGIYFVKVFDGEKSYCRKLMVQRD